MWHLGFFLLPIVLVASRELMINNYIINIENDTLISVQPTERSSIELNLSRLGLRRIANGSFGDKIDAKILNLAHNFLTELPESVFSNLTNLEHLLLVNNSITHFINAFVGLSKLQSLHISNNPVKTLIPGEFYGLSTSVNIFLSGTPLDKMSAAVFEKNTPVDQEFQKPERIKRYAQDYEYEFYGKLCIHEGIVKRLENFKGNEPLILPHGCHKVYLQYGNMRHINMKYLEITGFQRDWYHLEFPPGVQVKLLFKRNEISHITKELLNDLPPHVTFVDLTGNRIHHLKSGVIENRYLKGLDLTNNQLRSIETGALQNTNITNLSLDNNHLENIQFVETLPPNIQKFYLVNNNISELPAGSFLNIRDVTHLDLSGNKITILLRDSLQGLYSLFDIRLAENGIRTLQPGCFRDLESLEFLLLRGNFIANIDRTVFSAVKHLVFLDLGRNKLTRIMADSVPTNLLSLFLDFNEIESLESGYFANIPLNQLSLEGNKIKTIPKGTFNALNRQWVEDDDYNKVRRGLKYLTDHLINARTLWEHKIYIVPLESYSSLDFSGNPIDRLMNGALYGVPKDKTKWIFFSKGQIHQIQGGLFDDA